MKIVSFKDSTNQLLTFTHSEQKRPGLITLSVANSDDKPTKLTNIHLDYNEAEMAIRALRELLEDLNYEKRV